MSRFTRWLDNHGVRADAHSAGNLVKNLAPALALTPLGVVGAGAAGALGQRMRGDKSTAGLLKAGLSNAAIGGGLNAGAGLLHGAGSGSVLADGSGRVPLGPSLNARAGGALKNVGHSALNAAKKDPMGAVQAIGSTANGVMESRSNNAQLAFQRQQYEDEKERRRAIAEALAPLYKSAYTDQQQYYSQPRRY